MPKTVLKEKSREEYVVVKLPKSLIDEVDKHLGDYGYRSRMEFIKEAIRKHLFDIMRMEG